MRSKPKNPNARPAVVIGGELNGLGVCRSLAQGDVPTYVLDPHRYNAAMWSRHATPIRTQALHGANLVDELREVHGRLGGQPVLIVTDELALLTISELRDQLSSLFRFRLPTHSTVMMLHNKVMFQEYAIANGFPVPDGAVLREQADIQRIRRLRFPVIIKPADKRFFHSGSAFRLALARDWGSAVRICERLLATVGEAIVQECVDGPDSNICFCLFYRAGGRTMAMFTGRKLASSPPGIGNTAFCTQARDLAPELEGITHSLLERVEYEGFGGVEYKWDERSDRFTIIEPTVGRTDWQEEIAALCGVNIPLAGYREECGLPQLAPTSGRRVVWQGSLVERIKIGSEAAATGATVIDGFWRRDDPLPALIHYPRDFLISAPVMAIATARRWGRRSAHPFDRYGRRAIVPGQPPALRGLPSLSEVPGSDARNSTP